MKEAHTQAGLFSTDFPVVQKKMGSNPQSLRQGPTYHQSFSFSELTARARVSSDTEQLTLPLHLKNILQRRVHKVRAGRVSISRSYGGPLTKKDW